jgi:hypothetical protein
MFGSVRCKTMDLIRLTHMQWHNLMNSVKNSAPLLSELLLSSEQEPSSIKLLIVGLLLYSFFWVNPRRLNSDAGESPKINNTTIFTF